MKRDEKGLSGGERLLRRPVGAPRCASTVVGGIFLMAVCLSGVWAVTINDVRSIWFGFESGLFGPLAFIDGFFLIGLSVGILGNILNRGHVWAIRLTNIIYSILYYTYFLSILALLILAIFVLNGNFDYLIVLGLLLPLFIWMRRSQKDCCWLDLRSSPGAWELPYYAKDRERVLAARGIERAPGAALFGEGPYLPVDLGSDQPASTRLMKFVILGCIYLLIFWVVVWLNLHL
jgi:hypothetical protein